MDAHRSAILFLVSGSRTLAVESILGNDVNATVPDAGEIPLVDGPVGRNDTSLDPGL